MSHTVTTQTTPNRESASPNLKAEDVLASPRGLRALVGRQRMLLTVTLALLIGLPMALVWETGTVSVLVRTVTIGLMAMLAFGVLEQWPKRLPSWLARWVLQVMGVALVIPATTFVIYLLSTDAGAPPFWEVRPRLIGFLLLTVVGTLVAPWVALTALVRQKDALARHQALAFHLERSELERQALGSRLRLVQAQVAPHFLFNTLANVQALVDTGSPRAAVVLRSLVAYLRAAVPHLNEQNPTMGHELDLVQAYLELMHMRMPDRLRYTLDVDPATRAAPCPPMILLTLIEDAVRHGIDPSEEGGSIEIRVQRDGRRCRVSVVDTGVGLQPSGQGLGTGLVAMRERLELCFDGDAGLEVNAVEPHGVRAELDLPVGEPEAGA